jgi:hypothetical protein
MPTVTSSDYDANITEKKYQMQDGYTPYTTVEKNLQKWESQLFYLRFYINTKSKDTNFEEIKN